MNLWINTGGLNSKIVFEAKAQNIELLLTVS